VVQGEVVMVYSSQRSHQDSDGHSRANESVVSIMQSNKNLMDFKVITRSILALRV
jgi:hypothetical protein